MSIVKFGDIVKDVKVNVDRSNNPYEFYIAGDHMVTEDLTLRKRGVFATDDVGPAFIRIFKPGQVLYGSRRTYLKKVAVADFEGITANTTFVFETKDEDVLCQKLLPFIMLSEEFTKWSVKKSKGSTNPYVLFSDLADYEFELPSIAEQRVLADKLWAAYNLKESYKKMITATDEMVKAQFVEMFQGDFITHKWGDILTIANGKSYKDEYDESGNFPVYGSGGIMGYGHKKMCNKRTTVLGRKGNINSPIYVDVDYWVIDTAFSLEADCALLEPIYFYYWCTQFDFQKYNKQAVLPSLTKTDLLTIEMSVPPKDLQCEFVDIYKQADKSKQELTNAIEKIDRVIKSLLQ